MSGREGTVAPNSLSNAVIYDRGYRSYEGERRGRGAIRRALARDGIRRILGLRRKARRKILPWSLLVIGVVMASVIIGLHFVAGSIAAGIAEGLPSYPNLFDLYSRVALLFIAVTGPELLVPDRTQGVLSVYFSRPMRVSDYLAGKLYAYVTVAGAIYVVPQILLHLGWAGLKRRIPLLSRGQSRRSLEGPGRGTRLPRRSRRAPGHPLEPHRPDRIRRCRLSGHPHRRQRYRGCDRRRRLPGVPLRRIAGPGRSRPVRAGLGVRRSLGLYRPEKAGFDPWVSVVAIALVALIGAWFAYWRYRKQA
ncbi:MAG: hypothetical protein ACR2NT_01805 [Acidimicrobiia bacterium]